MLAKAKECWEQEQEEREAEKSRYLAQRIPTLETRGLSLSALQVGLERGAPPGTGGRNLSWRHSPCRSPGGLAYPSRSLQLLVGPAVQVQEARGPQAESMDTGGGRALGSPSSSFPAGGLA